MDRMLKQTKKRRLSRASQPQQFTQAQPQQFTQTQPQQFAQSQQHTRSQPRSLTQRRVQPLPYQQPPPQAHHSTKEKHPKKVSPEVASSQVKKTRGITRGLGTHNIVNATKVLIPIRMDPEQKLPQTVKANALFSSEIGSQTRKLAPLTVKTWKKVSETDKTAIRTALAIKFDFDEKDPEILKHIEAKMSKSYGQWKCKLHNHFKLHADDIEYARAHPPPEKLWGKRQMAEWEYLCDELYTNEGYQKRCKTNAENRSNLKYNHCGGSRPFQKHMEATLKKGKDLTIIENWGIMHQHQGGLGKWVNDEAAKIGKKMLDELEEVKQNLAGLQSISTDEISVPLPTQLEILKKGVGAMKGKTIKGLGYGPQRQDTYTAASSNRNDQYTTDELMIAIGNMAAQIDELEAKFAAYVKENTSPHVDDGIGENDHGIDTDNEDEEGEPSEDEEEEPSEDEEEEPAGHMH